MISTDIVQNVFHFFLIWNREGSMHGKFWFEQNLGFLISSKLAYYTKVPPPPPKDMRFFCSKNHERVLRAEPLCREDCQIFKIFRCLQKIFSGTREIFKTMSASYEELKKRCPWGGALV